VAFGQAPRLAPDYLQQDHVNPYSHQYNFTIQKELAGNLLFEVAYIANLSHKLGGQSNNDFGPDLTKLDPKVFTNSLTVTEHLIEPAKRIEDKYAMYRIVLDTEKVITAMIVAIVAGGVGAFLFHTTATVWAVGLDVLPFLVFMLLVLWLTLTRFFAWPPLMAAIGVAVFIAVVFGGGVVVARGMLPAGAYYLPPLAVLVVVAVILWFRGSPAGPSYFAAALVFAMAFAARELDDPLCPAIPVGTHFVWHLLAALIAFILIRAAILYAPSRAHTDNAMAPK
jgi:hypothetical protein